MPEIYWTLEKSSKCLPPNFMVYFRKSCDLLEKFYGIRSNVYLAIKKRFMQISPFLKHCFWAKKLEIFSFFQNANLPLQFWRQTNGKFVCEKMRAIILPVFFREGGLPWYGLIWRVFYFLLFWSTTFKALLYLVTV